MADDIKTESNEIQVVAFKLRKEEYGFSILNVKEIRGLTDITRVPFAPDFVKGVINLRGSVLPVIPTALEFSSCRTMELMWG